LDEYAAVEPLGRVFAYIAVAAVLVAFFSEVAEEDTPAADVRFAITAHTVQLLEVGVFLSAFFGKTAEDKQVAYRIEQQGVAFHSVASGTAYFLVVVLDTSGHIIMYDPTHIAFIYSHPEGNGCTDHVYPVVDKIILCLFALNRRESGMIGNGLDPVRREFFCQVLCTVPAHAVNDPALMAVGMDEMDDGGSFLLFVQSPADSQG